jgi:hypothetical protein
LISEQSAPAGLVAPIAAVEPPEGESSGWSTSDKLLVGLFGLGVVFMAATAFSGRD